MRRQATAPPETLVHAACACGWVSAVTFTTDPAGLATRVSHEDLHRHQDDCSERTGWIVYGGDGGTSQVPATPRLEANR